MKVSKVLPWLTFALVLVLAWMTLGRSSGYYDAAPGMGSAQAPGMGSAQAPVAGPVVPPAFPYSGPMWGLDYSGNELKEISKGATRDTCSQACEGMPGCKGFVMNADQNQCWLKSKFEMANLDGNRIAFARPGTTMGGLGLNKLVPGDPFIAGK